MDYNKAHDLLRAERLRVQELLDHTEVDAQDDRSATNEQGDMSDSAPPLIAEQEEAAIMEGLRERLAMIERAELRLVNKTYGLSIRSGRPISDERLEADPAAEVTAEEALSS